MFSRKNTYKVTHFCQLLIQLEPWIFVWGAFNVGILFLKELATRLGMSFFFIDVWNDPWIPNNPSFKPKAREGVQVTQQKLVVNLNIQEQEVETWTNYDNYFPKILSLMPWIFMYYYNLLRISFHGLQTQSEVSQYMAYLKWRIGKYYGKLKSKLNVMEVIMGHTTHQGCAKL